MALERVDGTFAASANISIGKARTAALFQKPTRAFEEIIANGRTPVALNDFTPLQGGVPITVDGQIVGGVRVTGAACAQQDAELAMTAAAAVSHGPATVTFFYRKQVQAAFEKGAVLLNQRESYMVHASRCENAPMADIHTKDADNVYTGGTAVDAKVTEADELRGSSSSWRKFFSSPKG